MAKKKIDETAELLEKEEIAVEEIEESIAEPAAEVDATEEFINRMLVAINKMENRAKAQRLAERVLRNRRGN